jgi:hypothetical protein
MAKLSEIQSFWEKDSKIDVTNLGSEATKIPQLHSKYLNLLSSTKLSLRKAESDYNQLRRKKFRYYRGEMSAQELKDEEWTQWQGTKPLKNEMDEFLTFDADLNLLVDKMEYFKTVVYQLEQILKSLNSRTWDIRNHIEWLKWTNGA